MFLLGAIFDSDIVRGWWMCGCFCYEDARKIADSIVVLDMGLDLHHFAPCAKAENTLDYFTEEDFADNPAFFDRHRHLLGEADDIYFDFTVYVFQDLVTKDLIFKRSPEYVDRPYLVGNLETLDPSIHEIVARHSLQDKERVILKTIDTLLTKDTGREIYYHTVSYETKTEIIQVLYHIEKGYQRKGMNVEFYDAFENGKAYVDKADVIRASRYLRTDGPVGTDSLANHFRCNFLNNFVEGESIFWCSW